MRELQQASRTDASFKWSEGSDVTRDVPATFPPCPIPSGAICLGDMRLCDVFKDSFSRSV